MARTVRDHRLETRAARMRLTVRAEPYWRQIKAGGHLGYYKGVKGGKWVARYRPSGRPGGYDKYTIAEADDYNESDGEIILSYSEAQDAARKWFEIQSHLGACNRAKYTVSDCLDDYLKGFSGRSLKQTQSRVEVLIRPALGGILLAELTTDQIAQWHRNRASSPSLLRTSKFSDVRNVRETDGQEGIRRRKVTANRDLTVLRAALNAAYRAGRIRSDEAWRRVKPFVNVERAKTRYLLDDEARRVVNACDEAFRPLVQASLLTGARYGELIAARVQDFDPHAGTIVWTMTKAGKSRVSYLEREGRDLFVQLTAGRPGDDHIFVRPDGKAWKASQQSRRLEKACSVAKLVPHCTFHDLRRTFGARLAMRGVPMAYIAEAMGHADERITRRHYAHLAPSAVAETIRASVTGYGIVPASNVQRLCLTRS